MAEADRSEMTLTQFEDEVRSLRMAIDGLPSDPDPFALRDLIVRAHWIQATAWASWVGGAKAMRLGHRLREAIERLEEMLRAR